VLRVPRGTERSDPRVPSRWMLYIIAVQSSVVNWTNRCSEIEHATGGFGGRRA
jgi:hypothetical protein